MKRPFKILLILTSLSLMFVFIGGYFFISSKMTPEVLKTEIEKSLQEALPNAIVRVGELSYTMGLSITVQVSSVEATVQDGPLFSLQNMKIFIPIWSLLTSRGAIDISLDNPVLHYIQMEEETNWALALGVGNEKKREDPDTTHEQNSSPNELMTSAPLLGSKLNISIKNLDFFFSQEGKNHRFMIDSLILKNIGTQSILSFEMNSFFNIELNESQKAKFRLTSLGEIKLKDFFEKSIIPISFVIKINDIQIDKTSYPIGMLESTIDFVVDKEKNIQGKAKLTYLTSNSLDFQFQRGPHGDIAIDNIESVFVIKDVLDDLKIHIDGLDPKNSQLSLTGGIRFTQGLFNPNINVKIEPQLQYSLNEIKVLSVLSAVIEKDSISLDTKTDLLGGEILAQNVISYDPSALTEGLKAIKKVKKDVYIKGIKIEQKHIAPLMLSPKDNQQEPQDTKDTAKANVGYPLLFTVPFVNGQNHVSIEDSFLGPSTLKGRLNMNSQENSITIGNSELVLDKGTFKINGTLKRNPQNIDVRFLGKMQNINASSFALFLPPSIKSVKGNFNGSLSGSMNYTKTGKTSYNVAVNVSATNGRVEKMDISKQLQHLVTFLPNNLKEKIQDADLAISPDFKSFLLDARFKENDYIFNKIHFIGLKEKVDIKGKGRIYPIQQKEGEILFEYTDQTGRMASILKGTGQKSLPLRFIGPGMNLTVDESYTIKQLTRKAVKNKAESAAKEAVQKNIKKIFKGKGNKKIRNLLEGFL